MTRADVIEKVKKLLALGGSANEHEAALAVAQAHRLLVKHQLTLRDVEGAELVHAPAPLPAWWKARPQRRDIAIHLLAGIATTSGCVAIDNPGGFRVAGQAAHVEVCQLVYAYLLDMAQRMGLAKWAEREILLTDPVLGRHPVLDEPDARGLWLDGFLFGFQQRILQRLVERERTEAVPVSPEIDPEDDAEPTAPTALVYVGQSLRKQADDLFALLQQKGMGKSRVGISIRSSVDAVRAGDRAGYEVPLQAPKGAIDG